MVKYGLELVVTDSTPKDVMLVFEDFCRRHNVRLIVIKESF